MDKLFHCQSNVLTYLSEQNRGNIPACMEERNRCAPSIHMPKLFMRTSLANLLETQTN